MTATLQGSSLPEQHSPNASDSHQFDSLGRPTQMLFRGDLQKAMAHRDRVRALPGLDPRQDPSITWIASRTEDCVADLMQAFFDVSSCNDKPTFEAVGFCTLGDPTAYETADVEATCRIVHNTLVQRCLHGFRGHPSEDFIGNFQSSGKRRKAQRDDVTGDCQTRFNNVINLLRSWKSVCSQVITSRSYIDRLVNAPASIARQKPSQQKCNMTKALGKKELEAAAAQHAKMVQPQYIAPTPLTFPATQKIMAVPRNMSHPPSPYTAVPRTGHPQQGVESHTQQQPPAAFGHLQPSQASNMHGDGNLSNTHGGNNYSHNVFNNYLNVSGAFDPALLSPFDHSTSSMSPHVVSHNTNTSTLQDAPHSTNAVMGFSIGSTMKPHSNTTTSPSHVNHYPLKGGLLAQNLGSATPPLGPTPLIRACSASVYGHSAPDKSTQIKNGSKRARDSSPDLSQTSLPRRQKQSETSFSDRDVDTANDGGNADAGYSGGQHYNDGEQNLREENHGH